MNQVVSAVLLLVFCGICLCISVVYPTWLSDANPFLNDFIGFNLLSVLGVILAISLASFAQLHLSLGRVRKQLGEEGLLEIRAELRSSAIWLIVLFVGAVCILFLKPLLNFGETGVAIMNTACLGILLVYILILADITLTIFELPT